MTLRAWNSFEFDTLGWQFGGDTTTRTAGTGQSGLASLRSSGGTTAYMGYGFSTLTELIVGFCYKHSSILDKAFFGLQSSSGDFAGNTELRFEASGAGEIVVKRANATVEIGRSGVGVLQSSIENYLEIRVLASTTVGEVEVRINGDPTPVLNLSGVNTGAASFQLMELYGSPSGTRDFSAWTFIEVDATPPNDFLGHIRFGVSDPNGNGNSSQMVGSDGNSTDNYLLVDDGTGGSITNDSDTTYVQSSTVGNKDTYAHEDLPTTALSIIAVCPRFTARKTDAGTRSMKIVTRRGGTDYDGATEQFLGTSYGHFKEALLVDPNTSAAWTEANYNAAEFGQKVES